MRIVFAALMLLIASFGTAAAGLRGEAEPVKLYQLAAEQGLAPSPNSPGIPQQSSQSDLNLKGSIPAFWGTLPQWLTFVGVVFGFIGTIWQLWHNRTVRKIENILSIADNTITHISNFKGQSLAQDAIQRVEGLHVPDSKPDAETYWATRTVQLSHINLVWRVWELAGRPKHGKPLSRKYDGWERFAREIVMKNLRDSVAAVRIGRTAPENLAGNDIWLGLHKYEVFPTQFVAWLDCLDYRP